MPVVRGAMEGATSIPSTDEMRHVPAGSSQSGARGRSGTCDGPGRSAGASQPQQGGAAGGVRLPATVTLVRDHSRVLEVALETFSRGWGNQLTAHLRALATVSIESVTMRSYDDYIRSLPQQTVIVMCTVEPARVTALVQLPSAMTMIWVDYLLGGPGMVVGDADRELTEIEFHLVRDLLQLSLGDLSYAFASIVPMTVNVKSVQYNPQFVQAAAASAPVIVATFAVRLGEVEDTATIMLPADVMLAGLRERE